MYSYDSNNNSCLDFFEFVRMMHSERYTSIEGIELETDHTLATSEVIEHRVAGDLTLRTNINLVADSFSHLKSVLKIPPDRRLERDVQAVHQEIVEFLSKDAFEHMTPVARQELFRCCLLASLLRSGSGCAQVCRAQSFRARGGTVESWR